MITTFQAKLKLLLACIVVGAIGAVLLAEMPHSPRPLDASQEQWQLPAEVRADIGPAKKTWNKRKPWGSSASAQVGVAKVRPVLQGVVVEAGQAFALYSLPGQSTVRLSVGGELPGGGEITSINSAEVDWIDSDGKNQHDVLFMQLAAKTSASASESGSSARKRNPEARQRRSRARSNPKRPTDEE